MRLRTLITKEFLDLSRNRAALLPVVLVTIDVAGAAVRHRDPGAGDDRARARRRCRPGEGQRVAGVHDDLSADARVQLFLFQQFLMLFLLTPITGAMALAAHAIVGEKQARTLEPLLATPMTTFELLTAKVVGALAADAGDLARRPGALLRRHRCSSPRPASQRAMASAAHAAC